MEQPEAPPVQKPKPSMIHDAFKLLLCIVDIAGQVAFSLPSTIFLYDGGNWRPRDLFIGESIVNGIWWIFLTACFISIQLSQTMASSILNTNRLSVVRRFNSYYVIRTFTIVTKFILWLVWLQNNEGMISSTESRNYLSGDKQTGESPKCPGKADEGYMSFRVVCAATLALMVLTIIYSVNIAYETIFSNPVTDKNDGDYRQKRSLELEPIEQGSVDWVYKVFAFLTVMLYLFSFVYFSIFFVHSFDNNVKLSLRGMVIVYFFLWGFFGLRFWFYYGSCTANKSIKDRFESQSMGSQIHAYFKNEMLFWFMFLVFEAITYVYYVVRSDASEIYDGVPRLDHNVIQQTDQWYVFQTQAVMRGVMLIEWAMHIVPTFMIMWGQTRPSPSAYSQVPGETTKPDTMLIYSVMLAWIVFAWIAILLMIIFNIVSASGDAYFAIHYSRYCIAFICVGAGYTLTSILIARMWANMTLTMKRIEMSWTIQSVQTMVVVPLYFILMLMVLVITWSRYDDLGNEVMRLLLKIPASTPVNGVTYYWWNTVLFSLIAPISLVRLMADNNGSYIYEKFTRKS